MDNEEKMIMDTYTRIIEIIKNYSEDEARRRINAFFKYESPDVQMDKVGMECNHSEKGRGE